MKVGKHDITLKNIQAYLQGNIRMLAEQYGPEFIKMEPHIREQVMFRQDIANPECVNNKECKECHCSIPGLFYADKTCGGECYPVMMNEEEWNKFKGVLRQHTLDNAIEQVTYPFDWKGLPSELPNIVSKEVTDKVDTSIPDLFFDAGEVKLDTIVETTFTVCNHKDVNIFIKNNETSCGCTTVIDLIGKIIKANECLDIDVKIDAKDKKIGKYHYVVKLTFNDNSISKLHVNFKLV
jgi:hypothetical protein